MQGINFRFELPRGSDAYRNLNASSASKDSHRGVVELCRATQGRRFDSPRAALLTGAKHQSPVYAALRRPSVRLSFLLSPSGLQPRRPS